MVIQGSSVIFAGATIVLVAAQPVLAAATQVTNVRLSPTNRGLNVVLDTVTGTRPQIVTSSRGNTLVTDIVNTQLRLTQGSSFRQNNPAPGIASVVVRQLDGNSIRLVVTGTNKAPESQPVQQNAKGITFNLTPVAAPPQRTQRPLQTAQNPPAQTPPTQQQPRRTTPPTQRPDVLVPNPEIRIQGAPATPPRAITPPVLPRAIAPPVGDIAISNADASPSNINLDTTERVPRLVLRDAPVREVLALLARAANLNLAFSTAAAPGAQPGQQDQQPQPTTGATPDEGPRISLDIEDESVQDVFNYVLRISGLQANRNGRTIFVAPRLSNEARNVIVRSLRLNQVTVGVAINFLVAMGAESAVSRERVVTSVNAVPVGGSASPVTQTQTSTETRVETQRIDFQDAVPLLRGLQVVGDERTNSVTLIGSPKQIDLATSQVVQIDSRRRQVAVNVRIVDVNLSKTDQLNTSFSFGIGDTFFQNAAAGPAIINFGRNTSPPGAGIQGNLLRNFTTRFLGQLEARVESGNAKILTDPTLTVQEGQTAVVNLTQELFGGFRLQTQTDPTTNLTTQAREPIIKEAGLILQLRIDRIDDNGFIALSVAPTVSALGGSINTTDGEISLLQSRQLTSGQIRLRDGQTLILSGIIQETDRADVNKVPILGDIPLLGALFRSRRKVNSRQEVIVLLTPQILDDSQFASSGYNYTPSPDARQLLERQGYVVPSKQP